MEKTKEGPDWVQMYGDTNERMRGLNDKSMVVAHDCGSGRAATHADAETEAEVRSGGRPPRQEHQCLHEGHIKRIPHPPNHNDVDIECVREQREADTVAREGGRPGRAPKYPAR